MPEILVHCRTDRPDHPALTVAMAGSLADRLRFRRMPELIPVLTVEVTHDPFLLGAVAGHHIAIRIDKESIYAHIAWQEPRLTVDVIDQPMVEIGPEPVLGTAGLKQFIDQVFEILSDHRPVMDDIAGLNEIEAVMK